MTPADPLDTSAVRSTPRPSVLQDPRPGRRLDTSRLVVLGFALLFLIGALGFVAAALNVMEQQASPSPTANGAAAVAVADAPDARTDGTLDQASPGPSQFPTVSPIASAAASAVPSICPSPSPASSVAPVEMSPAPTILVTPSSASDPPEATQLPSPAPGMSCEPAIATSTEARMPFVPVIRYWETADSISTATLKVALRGRSTKWRQVLIPNGDRAALEAALGITIPPSVREVSPASIVSAVKQGDTLGILRATDVQPSVRALGIDGRDLFGNQRVSRLSRWPLVARVTVADGRAWDQGDTWTLVAGGDSFTDRGIYERVVNRKKGVDYPFDGGRARVTGHVICHSCPRANGNSIPTYTLSGPKGIVRDMVKDADLAIANHEQPSTPAWSFHTDGTTFNGKPSLTAIFSRAGIDFMSLANNHIRDAGPNGVLATIKTLDQFGIKHAGAGRNLRQAAKPAYLTVNGTTVAIVSCDMIALKYVAATKTTAGAAPCKSTEVSNAIKAARKRADVLIVFPHWGIEFSRNRASNQEPLAARWQRLGVDLVLGAHSHIPGGIGDIEGMPVFYSLGNFIFDQNWSTATTESVLVEMTWAGDRLVQARLHPFLTVDQAQPNFLDAAKNDGKAILAAIRKASRRVSDW